MSGWLDFWWVWVAAGLVIAALEIVIPGFVFLGFAGGAVLTGIIVAFFPGLGGPAVFALFAGLSLLVWIVLRQVLGVRGGQFKRIDRDINEN